MRGEPLRGLHVLVVDGDQTARQLIVAMLAHQGALVTEADSGEAAWASLARVVPEVIVCALSLDDGRGARDLLHRLRTAEAAGVRSTPVVAIARTRDLAPVDEVLEAGFAGYVKAPFDWDRPVRKLFHAGDAIVVVRCPTRRYNTACRSGSESRIQELRMTTNAAHATSGLFHAVRFYQDDAALCAIVSKFLGEGLVAGQPAIAIATPMHREGILRGLREAFIDVKALEANGHLVLLDARETLATFMVDGAPDAVRFRASVGMTVANASKAHAPAAVRAYGEMVDVLWRDGAHEAAISLEMLWNRLAHTEKFSLLCGYSMGSFYKDGALNEIASRHTHVVSEDGRMTPAA